MEAILKLIVGVDGVTADMLVKIAWMYLAVKGLHIFGILAGLAIIGKFLLLLQRRCLAYWGFAKGEEKE